MTNNFNCLFVNMTNILPFKRCQFCERRVTDCFGFQFLVISTSIIILLVVTFFITDLPALVLDLMITITVLVTLLAYLASKETNEIVVNNALLVQLNKDLDEKVTIRTKELEITNEQLRKADQMKNEFIGVINHELKTPITAIISGLEIIKFKGTDQLDESQKKMLGIMDKSSTDMLRLANNLLDLSKIESGVIEIHPENFPLANMLEEVAQSLRPAANNKQVKIAVKIEDSITDIFADPDRFKQVIFNLADNAVKYSSEGGSVIISAHNIDHKIMVQVIDTGIGIQPEDIKNIFNKFTKHKAGYKGTGLGLYISKSFIEAHQGSIEVRSGSGKGTTFKVYLPKR